MFPKLMFKSTIEDVTLKTLEGDTSVLDDDLGIVECFAAAIGNKDSVGDIIESGAFNDSLRRRKPRVVWGHDWNHPIGKVLEIYEVGPNDPRLPFKMKLAGVGGLYARVQFNLTTEKGREAFNNIKFFGLEQEWSIGYKTLDAERDDNLKATRLKVLELYEISPVLHGANQLTATISFKSDEAGMEPSDSEIKRGLAMLKTFADVNEEFVASISDEIESKRYFSSDQRDAAADSGAAMEDGSFPIKNEQDLRNAVRAIGRAKDPAAAKAHIKKRAAALKLTALLPDDWKSLEEKVGPGNIDAIQDAIGGATRGHGPRRGNLEDLLDYWRPIMKKPGGFRRCLVILADHPELGPLPNLCAWLHHETTGKWPNEGHHHGAGHAAARAVRAAVPGKSAEWDAALVAVKDMFGERAELIEVKDGLVEFSIEDESFEALFKMMDGEPMVGKKKPKKACSCGGDCCKTDEIGEKVGRAISAANLSKIKQAVELLNDVLSVGSDVEVKDVIKIDDVSDELKSALEIVNGHHSAKSEMVDNSFAIEVKSDKHRNAVQNVLKGFGAFDQEIK